MLSACAVEETLLLRVRGDLFPTNLHGYANALIG
jgi:hypothetical protein